MTISSTTRKAGPYSGNDATTAFPFSFKVFNKGDIQVIITDSLGNDSNAGLDAHYSVTLNSDQDNNPGGVVTYPKQGAPLASGEKLTVLSAVAYSQPADLINRGGFYPKVIENALDRGVVLMQQFREIFARTVTFPPSDGAMETQLPTKAQRANSLLGFDADGVPRAYVPADQSAGALALNLLTSAGASMVGFIQSGVGAQRRNLQDRARDVVSAFDFMTPEQIADVRSGNASVDVSGAIQAAAYSRDNSGDRLLTVACPDGVYKMNSTVYVPEGVSIQGTGPWKTKFDFSGNPSDINFQVVSGGVYDYPPVFRDFAVNAKTGIDTGGMSGLHIENIWFSCVVGVQISGTADIHLRNLVFDGSLNGIVFAAGGQMNNVLVADCTFSGTNFGITVRDVRDLRIVNCDFRAGNNINIYIAAGNNNTDDVLISNCQFYLLPGLGDPSQTDIKINGSVSNVRISNNYFDGSRANVLLVDSGDVSNVQFTNNTVQRALGHVGMVVGTGASVVFADNHIVGPVYGRVFHYNVGADVYVMGNVIRSANAGGAVGLDGAAINIEGATLAIVKNNVMRVPTATHGLLVRGSVAETDIDGNNIAGAASNYSIFVESAYQRKTRQNFAGNDETFDGAAPAAGTWKRGDVIRHILPTAGENVGWICVAGGAPGTWKPYGVIGQKKLIVPNDSAAGDVATLRNEFNTLLANLRESQG